MLWVLSCCRCGHCYWHWWQLPLLVFLLQLLVLVWLVLVMALCSGVLSYQEVNLLQMVVRQAHLLHG